MKQRALWITLLLLCVLWLPVLVSAQDDTQTVDLGGGYSIVVPADWTVKPVNEGVFAISNDQVKLTVTTPTRLNALSINFPDDSNVVDVLVSLAFPFNGRQVDRNDVQKLRLDTRAGAIYENFSFAAADQVYAAVTLSDGAFGYVSFSVPKGELDTYKDLINSIIASFDSSGTLVNTGSSACTVSTDSADGAQLRVGPGPNRGAISFLPVNVEVSVTGRIELDDGSVWYQLDKAQAAPNGTAAAELWVAAQSVTATGDCNNVGDTAAPPIIQSIAPVPTQPPSSGAPDNSSAPPDTGASGGQSPAGGTWTMTFNATTNASCTGYENVAIPSTEVLDAISYTYSLRVVNSNSFVYGGDTYTRVPGTNTFTGVFTWRDGDQSQTWLNVNSATSINGQTILNFTLDNIPCSGTFLFLATHR